MDELLAECVKISPASDDLAMAMYPPIAVEDLEDNAKVLVNTCKDLIQLHLKDKTFVSASDYEEWAIFLLKALDHNRHKLDLVITQSKLESVTVK
jgi:hypothetical protein